MQFGHFSCFFRNGELAMGGYRANQEKNKGKSNCVNHKGIWSLRVVKIPSSYFDFPKSPKKLANLKLMNLYLAIA